MSPKFLNCIVPRKLIYYKKIKIAFNSFRKCKILLSIWIDHHACCKPNFPTVHCKCSLLLWLLMLVNAAGCSLWHWSDDQECELCHWEHWQDSVTLTLPDQHLIRTWHHTGARAGLRWQDNFPWLLRQLPPWLHCLRVVPVVNLLPSNLSPTTFKFVPRNN